jgi:hypothetical protein
MVSGALLLSFRSVARDSNRTLTFAQRVGYPRAIEKVYWRHRIWPKKRPDPKPSLDAAMSQAQLEKKVADYLRSSQALEDYWQRPLTGATGCKINSRPERPDSLPPGSEKLAFVYTHTAFRNAVVALMVEQEVQV